MGVFVLATARWRGVALVCVISASLTACGDDAGANAVTGSPAGFGAVGGTAANEMPGAPLFNPDTGEAIGPPTGDAATWCSALSVFQTSCHTCHGPELAGGAPMPIVGHADVTAPAISDPNVTVGHLIDARIHDPMRPMPPLSQPRLTTEQLATLESWLAAGMPGAGTTCGTTEAPPEDEVVTELQWPEDCQERYEIRAHQNGSPYNVPADSELNVDIDIPVPWAGGGSGAVQALAIRPITNNKRVVHHWILYAGGFDFITSWSPGKPFEVFPEGVGVHMPTSGNFRLNMHYFNIGNPNDEVDDSGLEVCITRDLRPNTATTYMFSGSATVPPGARIENVSTCTVNASEPVHLITSSPHMHSYGVGAKLEVVRQDGQVEVIEDAPFNWEDQHITPVDVVLNDGDEVRVTCIYQNDTARTIRFGESSEDEMCFNFARYYPMDAFSCRSGFF